MGGKDACTSLLIAAGAAILTNLVPYLGEKPEEEMPKFWKNPVLFVIIFIHVCVALFVDALYVLSGDTPNPFLSAQIGASAIILFRQLVDKKPKLPSAALDQKQEG